MKWGIVFSSMAKSCATLAYLSSGRFMLGAGIGWCREEYEALGMPWDHRGARFEEAVARMRRIWSQPEAAYEGRYLSFPPIVSEPKPPGGAVPVVVGGTSPTAARRAGRIGDGYFPAIFPTAVVYELLPRLLDEVRTGAHDANRDPSATVISRSEDL